MTILTRRAQVAIETEGTPGTAETLVAADVHFRVGSPSFQIQQEMYTQDMLQADLSELADLPGSIPCQISFTTLLAGSGTATTPPGWAEILIHGGFAETVGGSDVTYALETPCSTGQATIGMWFGPSSGSSGRLLIAKGCRPSNLTFSWEAGKPMMLTTTWSGAYSSSADASAFSSVTYDSTTPPVARNLGLTLGSWSPLLKSFSLSVNYGLGRVDDPGAASEASGIKQYEITSRRIDGTMTFLEVNASTKNWISAVQAGTVEALGFTLGSSSGNKIDLDMPKCQLLPSTMGDSEGLMSISGSFKAARDSAGNDELVLKTY